MPCTVVIVLLGLLCPGSAAAGDDHAIDAATVERWSQKFLSWHYWPDHVIPASPGIPGFPKVHKTDVPTVFQRPSQRPGQDLCPQDLAGP